MSDIRPLTRAAEGREHLLIAQNRGSAKRQTHESLRVCVCSTVGCRQMIGVKRRVWAQSDCQQRGGVVPTGPSEEKPLQLKARGEARQGEQSCILCVSACVSPLGTQLAASVFDRYTSPDTHTHTHTLDPDTHTQSGP